MTMQPDSATRSFQRRTLLASHTVVMPGAINALSARLIEQMGFEAMYLSGAVLANSVGGVPDVGLMTLTEAEKHTQQIAQAARLPILCDADTGYGERENTQRTVRLLEQAGASAIHLEDQEFPKRCGHLAGKRLVPAEAFCEKIAAACAALTSKDFLIIARTDARGVDGYDAAVERAHKYVAAGAEAIFPEALRTEEELRRFKRDVPVWLLANMTEFGTTPYFSVDQFSDMGYNMVIFPVTLQRAAMWAMQQVLASIRDHGTQEPCVAQMQTRQELYDLLGYDGKVNL